MNDVATQPIQDSLELCDSGQVVVSARAATRVAGPSSAAITTSMLVLAGITLAGPIFAWVVIGTRRTPDHIQATHAEQL